MEKTNSYEVMFIVDVSNGEEATKATVGKFTDLIASNGEIVNVAEWGKRRLAYPINDMNEGYYVVVNFKSEPSFPVELERLMNIDESVMRSMTLRPEVVVIPAEPEVPAEEVPAEEEVVAEEAPAEEAATEEPAPAEEV